MTRGDVKAALQALGYGTDTDSQQNYAIMATLRRVAGMHRWPWLERIAGAVTVAVGDTGADITAFSSVALILENIDSVRAEYNTTYLDLTYVQPEELRRLNHLYRDNGPLEKWSFYAGYLLTYPRADHPYTLTIDYVRTPVVLTADGDELPMPDSYDEIMKWGAAAHLTFRERDWFFHNLADTKFRELVAEAWAATGVHQRQSSTHVKRSGWNEPPVPSGWIW